MMNNNLQWDCNINKCIKDTNRTIAWVSRNVIAKDIDIMLRIYKGLIRPKLEYILCSTLESNCSAWELGYYFGAGRCPASFYKTNKWHRHTSL